MKRESYKDFIDIILFKIPSILNPKKEMLINPQV